MTQQGTSMESLIDAVEGDARPTSHVVVAATRKIDLTDRDAVRAGVAREQSASAPLTNERHEQEIRLQRNKEEAQRIRDEINDRQRRHEAELAVIAEQHAEDVKRLMDRFSRVMQAARANEAAIAVLDGAPA